MSETTNAHLDRARSAMLTDSDHEPAWVCELRGRAVAAFEARGLPTPRDEDWKHHPVNRHLRREFGGIAETVEAPDAPILAESAARLVFVDGRLVSSDTERLPEGVRVTSLKADLRVTRDGVPAWLGQCAEFETRGLAALNTADLSDGALVVLDRGVVLEAPIHVVHLTTAASADRLVNLRNLIIAGSASRGRIVEHHAGPGADAVVNSVTEIAVEERAELDFTKLLEGNAETAHLASVDGIVLRDGRLRTATISSGGAAGRTENRVKLADVGAECDMSLLALGRGKTIQDILTRVEHAAPHTRSAQLHRAIVNDSARSVFNGLVVVKPGAHGTVGEQSSRSLVLSPTADAHARPQLDISEDEVKCAHGATIGALDPDAIFYLRSRGLGGEQAQKLLVKGFAGEAIEAVEDGPARREAERVLNEWLER